MNCLSDAPFSTVILAGGAGSRMAGQDKGLLMFEAQPLVAHVLARVAGCCDDILISANRHLDDYARFGYPVVADMPLAVPANAGETYAGPLAALAATLPRARHEQVLCLPCDTPRLPVDVAQRLRAALGDAPLVVARCAGKPQPTVCLLRRALHPALLAFLARGERKMGLWQREAGAHYLDFDDPAQFANANTPADLAALDAPAASGAARR